MTAHGSNVIAVPVFQTRREVVARPAQLLKVTEVSPGKYNFDFSDVRRFIDMSKHTGMEYFEFLHMWLYWGVREPIHVYQQQGGEYKLLWPTATPPTTGVYRNFLEQYLPALRNFLDEEHLPPDRTFFHVSDEPPGETLENYKRARALLKELAPWMKVMDALSDVQYGKQHITDIPVVILESAQNYIDAGIPHWVYYCTEPRDDYFNRFYDTPLATIRLSGFLFYHLGWKMPSRKAPAEIGQVSPMVIRLLSIQGRMGLSILFDGKSSRNRFRITQCCRPLVSSQTQLCWQI